MTIRLALETYSSNRNWKHGSKKHSLQESDLIIHQIFTLSKEHAAVKNKEKAGVYKAKHQ